MNTLYNEIEPDIIKKGQYLNSNHPGAFLSKFSAPHDVTENDERAAYATLTATKYFLKSYKLRATEFGRQSTDSQVTFRRTSLEGFCPPRELPICLPAAIRYRTHDGTCNNLRRPRWGSAHLPFNRFLPPDYEDGVDSIRQSIEGGPLASARFVSLVVHGTKDDEAPVTLMLAQWGQLIDHDLTSTAQPRSINGSIPRCCGPDDKHPSCFPIKVPFDDPWLGPLKVRCLEFLRSAPAQRRDCVLAWREQTNQATSFLDASPIYSSSARSSDNGRQFRNGLLVFGRGNPNTDFCLRGVISNQCIRAGDPRSSEQPGLLALHHVWVSEHNHIASELSDLNPHWSDEKIYQETRRIVGALFQHITYREFLPLVLGKEVCRLFDLDLLNSGYYNRYDPHINPTVANSFAAAAFRFGHSLIQGSYLRCDRNHNFITNNVSLHEEFIRGDLENVESLHRLLRGMAVQRAQSRDEFITAELTNHLFQSGDFPFGLDLAAINIQRGRDHGVPRYTAWREPCGLSRIDRWEDLENIIGPSSTKRLSHAYQSVHDIDLFVGGIAERPVIGGLVGPTFACIIAQQFSNLRKGDRFWYENSGFENFFTPAQLHSIRNVNLAQILCRSVNGGTFQPHIFIPHDVSGNERIPCGIGPLASIDLLPWLEKDPFTEKFSSDLDAQESMGFHSEPTTSRNLTIINRIDFVPNGSTGIQTIPDLIKNVTKIHDKLDFKPKPRPPQKSQLSQNVQNNFGPQQLTKNKDDISQSLKMTPPSLPGILMFNNIPITISPIPFDDDQLKTIARIESRETSKKLATDINENFRLFTKDDATQNENFIKQSKSVKIGNTLNNTLTTTMQIMTTINSDKNNNASNNAEILKFQVTTNREVDNGSKFNFVKFILPTQKFDFKKQEKKFNIRHKRELDNLTDFTNTSELFTENRQKSRISETLEIDKQNLNENDQKLNRVSQNLTDTNQTDNLTTTFNNTIQSDNILNNLNEFSPTIAANLSHNEISTEVSVQNDKTSSQTNLTKENLTTVQPNVTSTDKEILIQTTTQTTSSKFDPELRTYTDLNDIEVTLTPSTMTHTTYVKTNSTVSHRPDGKIEFFGESKLTNTNHFDYKNSNTNYVTDENKSEYTVLHKEQPDNENETEHFLRQNDLRTKSNYILVNILRRILNNNFNRGTLFISSDPNARLTYVNSTEKFEFRQQFPSTIYGSQKKPSQKIVVGSPEFEEYEIEISINPVKTTKKPTKTSNPFNNKFEFLNKFNDFSSSSFNERKPTKPSSSFNENSNTYGQRTKPPTVIYIGESEETHFYPYRPSSQHSNVPQSPPVILDTSNNHFGSYYPIPSKGSAFSSSSSSSTSNSNGVSSSSSASSNIYGNSASATASASSSGSFGSVYGVTSSTANGNSPIFNVKIRPAYSTSTFSQSSTSTKKPYEFIEIIKPTYTNNVHTSSPYSNRYPSNVNDNKPSSVFSTSIKTNRPNEYFDKFQLTTGRSTRRKLTFYRQIQQDKLLDNGTLQLQKIGDSHTSTTSNSPRSRIKKDIHVDYITDHDDDNTDNITPARVQFDKDGYLRPEYMTLDIAKFANRSTDNTTNETKINDDYVLPILYRNLTNLTKTNLKNKNYTMYSDAIPRKPNFEIFSEDDFSNMNDKNDNVKERKNQNLVLFAPLNVLTRPERPDNWVVFNASETKSVLPRQPELKLEMMTSKEFPKPMNKATMGFFKSSMTNKSLKKKNTTIDTR